MRVLLLEDDEQLARAFARRLRHDGYAVDEVSSLAEVLFAIGDVGYDCLVLDRHVPDGDSLTILEELLAHEDAPPIVLVSADGDSDARVAGLAAGADDFLAKPFRLDELALRVARVIRMRNAAKGLAPINVLQLGSVSFDMARREVRRDGVPVHLSPIQYSVFEQIVTHRDRVVRSDEILDHCWDGCRDPFSNPLHTQMTRLRRIFEGALKFVAVHGVGYRLEILPVEPTEPAASPP